MPSQPNEASSISAEIQPGPPLAIILGPTAVGKTEISIRLARRLGGEIVSADSRLFYRGMDIGTAKPTPEERSQAPHHLIDVADPDQAWSLALFQQHARKVIADIHSRGRLPMLAGGTGQYIRAITEGWQAPRVAPDPRLRSVLEKWAQEIGGQGLYERLATLDPGAAARIDPRNLRRTVRALEVVLSSGRLFSQQRSRGSSPYSLLQIGLTRPRQELYARVDARIEAMFAAGFVDEVRALLDKGYSPSLPTLSAIGYREVITYLQGKITLDEAVQEIRRATRVLVRRQANWFKTNDPEIHWFQAGEDPVDEIEDLVVAFLAKLGWR